MYKDSAAEWRWRLRANNGKIVADSAEGYKNKSDCEKRDQYRETRSALGSGGGKSDKASLVRTAE
jgi:hypothetical protein